MNILTVALQNNLPQSQTIDEAFQMNWETIADGHIRAQASGICWGEQQWPQEAHSLLFDPFRNQSNRN